MEELLELTKKQLRFQKIITGCLALIIVMLLGAGVMLANQMKQMSVAMNEAAEKLEEIDVDAINDTISDTQEMMESIEEFSTAVDEMTAHVQEFDGWISGLFGN